MTTVADGDRSLEGRTFGILPSFLPFFSVHEPSFVPSTGKGHPLALSTEGAGKSCSFPSHDSHDSPLPLGQKTKSSPCP